MRCSQQLSAGQQLLTCSWIPVCCALASVPRCQCLQPMTGQLSPASNWCSSCSSLGDVWERGRVGLVW
jgi:hypothetical protein